MLIQLHRAGILIKTVYSYSDIYDHLSAPIHSRLPASRLHFVFSLSNLAPQSGFEPETNRLTAGPPCQ